MLGSMTVYRSHSPLHLMSSTIGGVLDMQTLDNGTKSTHTGIDSWNNAWLRGFTPFKWENQWQHLRVWIVCQQRLPYFDNRNTPSVQKTIAGEPASTTMLHRTSWELGLEDRTGAYGARIQGYPDTSSFQHPTCACTATTLDGTKPRLDQRKVSSRPASVAHPAARNTR